MTKKEQEYYSSKSVITSKTIELIIIQLILIHLGTHRDFLKKTIKILDRAKYYGRSDISEVTTVWYNYDYPEN